MSLSILVGSGVAVGGAMVAMARRRHRRQTRDAAALAASIERNLHLPQSLHPVIDPDLCIGSLSCLQACPEGDILGIVDGAARLISASHCIGHGRCAVECPVGAIRLVFGSSERGVDLPELSESFETSRPGVHIVGELGGMGLIKNAVTQGVELAAYLRTAFGAPPRGSRTAPGAVDVAIVGAGPAGLATAVGCQAAGISYRVLEQGTLGGTIAQYPRHKVVMTEPVVLPSYGKLGKRLISKEELLALWEKVLNKTGVSVEEGVKMTGIEGADGTFRVLTDRGEVASRKVVLALGRRGTPRKLGAPGEELPKVTYRLIDPDQYQGKRVLVVGGGDAALEAAIQLAEQSNAQVTISYRSEAFAKCREANRQKIAALIQHRRVRALMSSQVMEVRPSEVLLKVGDSSGVLPNDYVIVCIGGELPLELLKKVGVGIKRHSGTPLAAKGAAGSGLSPAAVKKKAEKRRDRVLAFSLFVVGALIVAGLATVGWEYYLLPAPARLRSPLHATLRPAGPWGHGVGIVATLFMLSNFLYSVRKRWRVLKGSAPIRRWLTFHMFVGFMSPLVIAFHAAFQSNNQLATATTASLFVVVATGIVGRFIFGLVPASGGKAVELSELVAGWERLKHRVEPLLDDVANPAPVKAILARATAPATAGSLVAMLLRMPFDSLGARLRLLWVRRKFRHEAYFLEFRAAILRLLRLRAQVRFYRSLKRLLSTWRLFHAVLACFLVVVISAHIALSLYLGYRWIYA